MQKDFVASSTKEENSLRYDEVFHRISMFFYLLGKFNFIGGAVFSRLFFMKGDTVSVRKDVAAMVRTDD